MAAMANGYASVPVLDDLRGAEGSGLAAELREMLSASLAALPPLPEPSLETLLDGWQARHEHGVEAFTAEHYGYDFLGLVRRFAGDDGLPETLGVLVDEAEQHGGHDALAVLRVFGVVAPLSLRNIANQAADRLVSAGHQDPLWARELGAPRVSTCFGYSAILGEQEAVATTFRYGKKRHVLSVLIDHGLGGGIKDFFASEHPNDVRRGLQQTADDDAFEFYDYEPVEAGRILKEALNQPPCPVEPDQVGDVGAFLGLVEQRTGLLLAG